MSKILINTFIATFITSILAIITIYFLNMDIALKPLLLSASIFFTVFFLGKIFHYQSQKKQFSNKKPAKLNGTKHSNTEQFVSDKCP